MYQVIQANDSNWKQIPEIVDTYFKQGKLQTGAVLIQNCGDVTFELKSTKIKTVRQSFLRTGTCGAYLYEAGIFQT